MERSVPEKLVRVNRGLAFLQLVDMSPSKERSRGK